MCSTEICGAGWLTSTLPVRGLIEISGGLWSILRLVSDYLCSTIGGWWIAIGAPAVTVVSLTTFAPKGSVYLITVTSGWGALEIEVPIGVVSVLVVVVVPVGVWWWWCTLCWWYSPVPRFFASWPARVASTVAWIAASFACKSSKYVS